MTSLSGHVFVISRFIIEKVNISYISQKEWISFLLPFCYFDLTLSVILDRQKLFNLMRVAVIGTEWVNVEVFLPALFLLFI